MAKRTDIDPVPAPQWDEPEKFLGRVICERDEEDALRCIEEGVDINAHYAIDFGGCRHRPIVWAVKYGRVRVVCALLTRSARYDWLDQNDMFAEAINGDRSDIVRVLLERGVDINDDNNFRGITLLHGAVKMKANKTARMLIELGARIDMTSTMKSGGTSFQATALDVAVSIGNVDAVRILVEAGAFNVLSHFSIARSVQYCISKCIFSSQTQSTYTLKNCIYLLLGQGARFWLVDKKDKLLNEFPRMHPRLYKKIGFMFRDNILNESWRELDDEASVCARPLDEAEQRRISDRNLDQVIMLLEPREHAQVRLVCRRWRRAADATLARRPRAFFDAALSWML